MIHEIKTSGDDYKMTIQKVQVESINGNESIKQQDEICISIIDALTNEEHISLITKQSAMELANKLLSIATSIK